MLFICLQRKVKYLDNTRFKVGIYNKKLAKLKLSHIFELAATLESLSIKC